MTDRVRGLLITPDGDLLTIRRIRPGEDPYWVLPGGGVEGGEDLETALARELREEAAATAEIHSLMHIVDHDTERQYFYLAGHGPGPPTPVTAPDRSSPTPPAATTASSLSL
jgi:ADP-ribose pyrophosphatase YjhB (NUDIX family)